MAQTPSSSTPSEALPSLDKPCFSFAVCMELVEGAWCYQIKTQTTSGDFGVLQEFTVFRQYSDFRWLYNTLQALYPHIIVPPLPMSDIFGELLWLCFIVLEEDSECLSWVGIALLSSPTHSLCLCGSLAVYLPDSSSSRCGRSCLSFFGDGEAEQITVRNYDEYRVRLLSLFLRRVVRVPALRSCEFFRKFILAWDQEYTDAVHASQEAVKGLKRGLGTRFVRSLKGLFSRKTAEQKQIHDRNLAIRHKLVKLKDDYHKGFSHAQSMVHACKSLSDVLGVGIPDCLEQMIAVEDSPLHGVSEWTNLQRKKLSEGLRDLRKLFRAQRELWQENVTSEERLSDLLSFMSQSAAAAEAYIASSEEIQNEFEKDEEDLSSREEKLAKLQSKGSANPGKVEKAVSDVERLRAFVDRKRVMLQEVTSNMEGQLQAFNNCRTFDLGDEMAVWVQHGIHFARHSASLWNSPLQFDHILSNDGLVQLAFENVQNHNDASDVAKGLELLSELCQNRKVAEALVSKDAMPSLLSCISKFGDNPSVVGLAAKLIGQLPLHKDQHGEVSMQCREEAVDLLTSKLSSVQDDSQLLHHVLCALASTVSHSASPAMRLAPHAASLLEAAASHCGDSQLMSSLFGVLAEVNLSGGTLEYSVKGQGVQLALETVSSFPHHTLLWTVVFAFLYSCFGGEDGGSLLPSEAELTSLVGQVEDAIRTHDKNVSLITVSLDLLRLLLPVYARQGGSVAQGRFTGLVLSLLFGIPNFLKVHVAGVRLLEQLAGMHSEYVSEIIRFQGLELLARGLRRFMTFPEYLSPAVELVHHALSETTFEEIESLRLMELFERGISSPQLEATTGVVERVLELNQRLEAVARARAVSVSSSSTAQHLPVHAPAFRSIPAPLVAGSAAALGGQVPSLEPSTPGDLVAERVQPSSEVDPRREEEGMDAALAHEEGENQEERAPKTPEKEGEAEEEIQVAVQEVSESSLVPTEELLSSTKSPFRPSFVSSSEDEMDSSANEDTPSPVHPTSTTEKVQPEEEVVAGETTETRGVQSGGKKGEQEGSSAEVGADKPSCEASPLEGDEDEDSAPSVSIGSDFLESSSESDSEEDGEDEEDECP